VPEPAAALAEKVRRHVAENPRAMTLELARRLGVPELEIIRAQLPECGRELNAARFAEIVERLAGLGRCQVIVSNSGCTMESFGVFGGVSSTGPFLNVQTEGLDMHIRKDAIRAAVCFDKPGHLDGVLRHSVQFYGADGAAVFKAFVQPGADGRYTAGQEAAYEGLKRDFGM
jgi:putative heme iron utilization protein